MFRWMQYVNWKSVSKKILFHQNHIYYKCTLLSIYIKQVIESSKTYNNEKEKSIFVSIKA